MIDAKAMHQRLREAVKDPRWSKDQEALGILKEARELIAGKAGEEKR